MKFVWEINGDFLKEPNYHYVQYHCSGVSKQGPRGSWPPRNLCDIVV